MFDDLIDLGDDENQKALGIAMLVELLCVYFMFSDPLNMGFGTMSLFLRIIFIVLAGPLMFVVVKITLNRV